METFTELSALLILNLFQVLDNGLLIDPHDQQSIASALLRLVAEKQLWVRCRDNGLKNIYRYSWPEHCKAYLARVVSCNKRPHQWFEKDDDSDDSDESDPDSPEDSLRDIHDISLNIDSLVDLGSGILDKGMESIPKSTDWKSLASDNLADCKNSVVSNEYKEKKEQATSQTLRRRKFIFVITVDCEPPEELVKIIKLITEVGKMENRSSVGFILSTSLNIFEIKSLLTLGGLSPYDFDAFICNSGADLYYPCASCEDKSFCPPFMEDNDYHPHIDYRWPGVDLRKALIRWIGSLCSKKGERDGPVITEYDSRSGHCYAFKNKEPELVISAP